MKLRIDGKVVSQGDDLIQAWMNHFHNLSKSKVEGDTLSNLSERIQSLATTSLQNEEYILDVSFTLDEVRGAVARLKSRKSCGSDGLSAEHLKWLGCITPIYKGGGKDPLLTNSYRGITVNLFSPSFLSFWCWRGCA